MLMGVGAGPAAASRKGESRGTSDDNLWILSRSSGFVTMGPRASSPDGRFFPPDSAPPAVAMVPLDAAGASADATGVSGSHVAVSPKTDEATDATATARPQLNPEVVGTVVTTGTLRIAAASAFEISVWPQRGRQPLKLAQSIGKDNWECFAVSGLSWQRSQRLRGAGGARSMRRRTQ